MNNSGTDPAEPTPDALFEVKTIIKDWQGTGHPAEIYWEYSGGLGGRFRFPLPYYETVIDGFTGDDYSAAYIDALFTLEQTESWKAGHTEQYPDQEVVITPVKLPIPNDLAPMGANNTPSSHEVYRDLVAYGYLIISLEARKVLQAEGYAERMVERYQTFTALGAKPGMTADELKAIFMPLANDMVEDDLNEGRDIFD